jgi:hypothetical protein
MSKRHKWEADGESCENCGYYVEGCFARDDDGLYCGACRGCSPNGKCIVDTPHTKFKNPPKKLQGRAKRLKK